MVPTLKTMQTWSTEIETEIASLLKDWLKQQGKTQADLSRSLKAMSTRMPALLEVLKQEYLSGGTPKLAKRLCEVEKEWSLEKQIPYKDEGGEESKDPFGQLDLILQDIRDNCED